MFKIVIGEKKIDDIGYYIFTIPDLTLSATFLASK